MEKEQATCCWQYNLVFCSSNLTNFDMKVCKLLTTVGAVWVNNPKKAFILQMAAVQCQVLWFQLLNTDVVLSEEII